MNAELARALTNKARKKLFKSTKKIVNKKIENAIRLGACSTDVKPSYGGWGDEKIVRHFEGKGFKTKVNTSFSKTITISWGEKEVVK
ncbi:hypothetical protein ACQKND_04085 [Viridibacillus arvi]|uniref:hypothetical protein n=1 Tax=Viridibacillus arvi TaxID=263475 RepID=UPI003D03A2CA